jgi:phospholipid/cholesterol/gamma-HCH transport system substrate-binding protein
MRKEVKIGIYAVVILLCAWAGIRFLSGLDVFGRSRNYKAHYEQVNGLQDAAAVVINGVKVGQVTGVEVNIEKGGVDVVLSVDSDFDIPTDSKAMMFSAGLMGGKSIEIKMGQAKEFLKSGDAIQTGVTLDMFDTLANELGDIKERVATLLDNLNQTISGVDSLVDGNSKSLTATITNLNKVMAELNRSNIIGNIDGFCATLNQNGAKLDSIISDVNAVTHSLNEQNIGEKLNAAINEVNTLLARVSSGNGTVSNLVNDEKLYKELAQASQNLSLLLADLKENPKRYINVTVFGKKSYEEKQADKAAKKAAKEAAKEAKQKANVEK